MNIRRVASMLLLTPLLFLYPYVPAAGTEAHPVPAKPLAKNVIVMVADGGGFNQFEAGSIWDTGERQGEIYNDFPFRFAMSTYSWGEAVEGGCEAELGSYDPVAAWAQFDYVLDGSPIPQPPRLRCREASRPTTAESVSTATARTSSTSPSAPTG